MTLGTIYLFYQLLAEKMLAFSNVIVDCLFPKEFSHVCLISGVLYPFV